MNKKVNKLTKGEKISQERIYLSGDQKQQQRIFVVRTALSQGTQAAVVKFGISERTIRSWKRRFKQNGVNSLKDMSRAAKRVWNKKDLDEVLQKAIVDLEIKEPGLESIIERQRKDGAFSIIFEERRFYLQVAHMITANVKFGQKMSSV